MPELPAEALAYYADGHEQERLLQCSGVVEFARTQEILRRHLAPPPARVLDVGGGAGIHAAWLAADGYEVHLVDPVPLHVEQAAAAARRQPDHPFMASLGDARRLEASDASVDGVLLLGPLYHLTNRQDRIRALAEAGRVLRPAGYVFAAAISRFASLLDSLRGGFIDDPAFKVILEQDLKDGQHRNPSRRPEWFTTAFFHDPDELAREVADAGLILSELLGIEGPGWLLPDLEERWADPPRRQSILYAAQVVGREPRMVAISAHLLAVATRAPAPPPAGATRQAAGRIAPKPRAG